MIWIEIEFDLIEPHRRQLDTFLEWSNLWLCQIVYINTKVSTVSFKMRWKKFKSIWGYNPKTGPINVPDGMEWVNKIYVRKVYGD